MPGRTRSKQRVAALCAIVCSSQFNELTQVTHMLHFFLFIHVQKYDDKRYRIFFMRFPYFAFVYACGFACVEVPFCFEV